MAADNKRRKKKDFSRKIQQRQNLWKVIHEESKYLS